ncbi:response regulator transcription factor [Azohydromonas australica]|uniref:response regulator transcription factor n=1 Tax=Azohydromonas australica TaxID=364039 RepID=UPI0004010F51|nr:response regulator transcription factor [Azohydromonas australica]
MWLLLIEDDEVTTRELVLRWQQRNWSVLHCGTLAQAQAAVKDGAFDAIVLDRGLPDGDGLDWLQSLRRHDRLTPVLMVSGRSHVADRVAGLRAGADAYMVKPFAPQELDARIDALVRVGERGCGEMLRFGKLSWFGAEGSAVIDGRRLRMFRREFEVLGMLMRDAPNTVAKTTLAEALAQRNGDVCGEAAEVYVCRLRKRLAGSGIEIQTVPRLGYRLALGS